METLSLCFLADFHIGARRRMHTDAFKYSFLVDAIERLPMHAFDIIFILGDVFDSPEPTVKEILIAKHIIRVLKKDKLKKNGKIVTIAGNHDMPSGILDPSAVELIDSHLTIAQRKNMFLSKDIIGMNVHAIPAGIPKNNVEDILTKELESPSSDLIVMHYPIEGAIRYDTTRTIDRNLIENIAIPIAMGDIHDHMFLGENKFYASSIIEAGFGETDMRHGFVTAKFSQNTREVFDITFFENIPTGYTFDMDECSLDEIRHRLKKLEKVGNNPAIRIVNATADFSEEKQSYGFSNFIIDKKKESKKETERTAMIKKATTEEKLISWLRLQGINEDEIGSYISLYKRKAGEL